MGRTKADTAKHTAVTAERATRLAKLLKLTAKVPRGRELLLGKLKVDIRGFYRDVKTVRGLGIALVSTGDQYKLSDDLDEAVDKLPCPDPQLTIAELRLLAKGNSDVHRKLKRLLDAVIGSPVSSNGHYRHR